MSNVLISIKNIKKVYDNNTTIRYKNLQIKDTGIVIIQGQSGSGKSTLFRIISGIERDILTDGEDAHFRVGNIDFITAKQKEIVNFRRKNIGFIFQDYGLLRDFTIEENITIYGSTSFDKKNSSINDLISKFFPEIQSKNIEEFKKKFPFQLSGGQQQRVALLRAILHEPSIILADEPTSNLDKDVENTILKKLQELSKKSSIILITHNESILNELGNKSEIYELKKRTNNTNRQDIFELDIKD